MAGAGQPRRRLGRLIGVALAIFVALVDAAGASFAVREMSELTYEAALDKGRSVLEALAIPAAVAVAGNEYTRLDNFIAEQPRNSDIESLLVLDRDGRVLATSRNGVVGAVGSHFDPRFLEVALATSGVHFRFGPDPYRPIVLDISKPLHVGQRWGTLVARFSLDSYRRRVDGLAQWAVFLTVVVAGLSWLIVAGFLTRYVIAPTRSLAHMAHRIGEGDLDQRSRIDRDDEIGELANALNLMASQLKRYTTRLEDIVSDRTRELEALNQELERLATTDALTGLRNFRYFQNAIETEARRAARHPHPLTVCMVDIDHFKKFNDTHGHPAGDEVLRRVGAILRTHLRSSDLVARYGGEEFVIVLYDTAAAEGLATAEKIARIVREERFVGAETQPGGRLTISIGVATFPEDADRVEELVAAADRALYEAKYGGRDRVVRFDKTLPPTESRSRDLEVVAP